MTDQEIIEQVAVEVMGWIPGKDILIEEFGPQGEFKSVWTIENNCAGQVWNPLTNTNHWMMVVEKVMSLDGGERFNLLFDFRSKDWFIVALWDHKLSDEWEEFEEHPFGKSVCLAALEAARSNAKTTNP